MSFPHLSFIFIQCSNTNNLYTIGRAFADGSGDIGVQSQVVIPKTQKVVFDTSLINTQHYKVRFKGKVEQSKERRSALPYTSVY